MQALESGALVNGGVLGAIVIPVTGLLGAAATTRRSCERALSLRQMLQQDNFYRRLLSP
jgi:hypothetical protein